MYKVFFYKNKNGEQPVKEYIKSLSSRTDKDSRIKVNKIYDYIDYLKEVGQQAKEPYAKNLGDGIWELRPISDRILYAAWENNSFILLHHFVKKTQKTPSREIKQAKRNLKDYKERN